MKNKIIMLLGGNSDIAIATAHKFAKKGCDIQLASRNLDHLKKTQSDLKKLYNIKCWIYEFDIEKIESHLGFFQNLEEKPHIVICAVGFFNNEKEINGNIEKTLKIINTNYLGPSIALEAAAKVLITIPEKTYIVGISSVSGDRGRSKTYTYGSAKAGFNEYLSGLRQKYNGTNLNVITFKPGFVKTKMSKNLNKPNFFTSTKEEAAEIIYKACETNKNIVYTKYWKIIMGFIKIIPENIFKKLKF